MDRNRIVDGTEFTEDTFWLKNYVASMTDCTGLAPSGIITPGQSDSIGALYAIHPPQPAEFDDANIPELKD